MRILFTGFVVFVIWAFFSTWLFVDVLRYSARQPLTEQMDPKPVSMEADSLAKLYAMMPKDMTIYFEFDKVRFIPDPQIDARLGEFKAWLDKYPESMLLITGHTDLVGENAYNKDLGLERALVIKKLLEGKGLPVARIIADSRGEDEPVAGYISEAERAKNRRTVISIKK